MLTVRHGTKYRYQRGCRCEPCREAQRLARRQTRDRSRAELRPSYLRELATSRAYKDRIVGSCESCGAETQYSGHGRVASRHCGGCSRTIAGAKRRGSGPMQKRLAEILTAGPRRFSELRDALGITSQHTSVLLNREVMAGRVRRVSRGVYALPEDRRKGVEAAQTTEGTEPS